MRKTILALAVLGAASGYAMAQSSVTLYGNIDGGLTVNKIKGKDTTVEMSDANWASNSFGIKGVEDLGGNNAVFFNLQQGFNISNGQVNNGPDNGAFNREAILGVSGDWGKFAFGRFGGLTSDTGSFSILGGSAYGTNFQAIGSLAGTFVTAPRVNNGLVYVSPDFGGVNLYAAYSNGITDDNNKWSHNGHYYGLGATYNAGNFASNISWEAYDHLGEYPETSDYAGKFTNKLSNVVTLGASYDFGAFTLYGAYQYANHVTSLFPNLEEKIVEVYKGEATRIKGASQNAFSLSASAPLGGGTAYLQSQFAFGKLGSKEMLNDGVSDKYNMWSVGTAYTYPISKRTLVYAQAAYGSAGKAMKSQGFRGWNATMGVSHSF